MKKYIIAFVCVALSLSALGCQSMGQKAKTGTLVGTVAGAGIGGIIGHQSGHGAEGAAIGAGVGALTGVLVGNQMDKNASQQAPQQQSQAVTTKTQAPAAYMNIQEVVDLAKQGVHEEVIIDRIRLQNARFNLFRQDIEYLRNQGVSEKVIQEMQARSQ